MASTAKTSQLQYQNQTDRYTARQTGVWTLALGLAPTLLATVSTVITLVAMEDDVVLVDDWQLLLRQILHPTAGMVQWAGIWTQCCERI